MRKGYIALVVVIVLVVLGTAGLVTYFMVEKPNSPPHEVTPSKNTNPSLPAPYPKPTRQTVPLPEFDFQQKDQLAKGGFIVPVTYEPWNDGQETHFTIDSSGNCVTYETPIVQNSFIKTDRIGVAQIVSSSNTILNMIQSRASHWDYYAYLIDHRVGGDYKLYLNSDQDVWKEIQGGNSMQSVFGKDGYVQDFFTDRNIRTTYLVGFTGKNVVIALLSSNMWESYQTLEQDEDVTSVSVAKNTGALIIGGKSQAHFYFYNFIPGSYTWTRANEFPLPNTYDIIFTKIDFDNKACAMLAFKTGSDLAKVSWLQAIYRFSEQGWTPTVYIVQPETTINYLTLSSFVGPQAVGYGSLSATWDFRAVCFSLPTRQTEIFRMNPTNYKPVDNHPYIYQNGNVVAMQSFIRMSMDQQLVNLITVKPNGDPNPKITLSQSAGV